jgi:hypothetical protein
MRKDSGRDGWNLSEVCLDAPEFGRKSGCIFAKFAEMR